MRTAHAGYQETLHVPPSWWLMGAGLVVAVWWVFFVVVAWPVSVAAGAAAAALMTASLLRYGAVRVVVEVDEFRVGVARLAFRHVGSVEGLDRAATRRALRAHADARAYLVIRAYCPGSVKVSVDDAADPAPYWLVSTRRPSQLTTALNRALTRDGVQD